MDKSVMRDTDKRDFISAAGWATAAVVVLAGDASNRRYDRLTRSDGRTAVLMDAPPEKGENVRPFIRIARFLTGCGLSAPEILHADEERGFLLIEDLGDALFARELAHNPTAESTLYRASVDVLSHLHRVEPPALKVYASAVTTPLAALAFDWYQLGATGRINSDTRQAFCTEFAACLKPLDDTPHVLIQRDYHAENLLWLPERKGVARVGLLDFQDAMAGHPAYDLVSILQDARRDVGSDTETLMKQHFLLQNPQDQEAFDAAYAVMGAQRNLRILGVFARLCMRDGKTHYVDLIPRVWAHIETNLAHPVLTETRRLLQDSLPAPTPEILNQLRAKCATMPRP
jgi:aminoglycoside/choline kinase family phosphotransferase